MFTFAWRFFFFFVAAGFFSVPATALDLILQHRQGDGVGYKNHYSKISLYHAFERNIWQPFIDLRYLALNKGRPGANLGAGLGYQFARKSRLSFYAYFDLTKSCTRHLFTQITPGIAYTHPLLFANKQWGEIAFYVNGYFPIKSLEHRISPLSFSRFRGNDLLICQMDRFALAGTNIEVGYRSKMWGDWAFYLAGSGYYFKRSSLHAFGGFGKFRVLYKDLISLEVQVSKDRLFGTNVNGTIGVRIPLGSKSMRDVKDRCYHPYRSRPIERFEPMVLDKAKKELLAKDFTGNPLYFIFVNNLSGSDGTFEDPFPTLADAQISSEPGDFIYVFPGDGTTQGMDSGFVMQPGQTLAGSGAALPVATNLGTIIVPNLTATRPILTNSMGDGVTLANECTLSGIDVVGASENGFYYEAMTGSSTVKFSHCSAHNNNGKTGVPASGGFAIAFAESNASVTASFDNCLATGNMGRGDGSGGGFAIGNALVSDGSLVATFTNCSAIGNIFDGSPVNSGFSISSRNSNNFSSIASFTNCFANENIVSRFGGGFSINLNNSPDSSFITSFTNCVANGNRSILGTTSAGGFLIDASSQNSTAVTSFTNCTANGNTLTDGGGSAVGGFARSFSGNMVSAITSFTNCVANRNTVGLAAVTGGFASFNVAAKHHFYRLICQLRSK